MTTAESPDYFAFALEAAHEGTASVVAWAPADDPSRIVDWYSVDPGEEVRDEGRAADLSEIYGVEVVFLGAVSVEQLETVTQLGDK